MQIWTWLLAAGILLVVEMLTVDLLFASLAFSALLAAGAHGLGFGLQFSFSFGSRYGSHGLQYSGS